MKEQTYYIGGHAVTFDADQDKDCSFINALAEASEASRISGAKAGKEALKGALSLGLSFGVRPKVDGAKVTSFGSIDTAIDGTLAGMGEGGEA